MYLHDKIYDIKGLKRTKKDEFWHILGASNQLCIRTFMA